ncbi:MAG: HU family DNA-binding protein [Candidatus Firestonebacteria bacterium]
MVRSDIVKKVAEASGLSKSDADRVVGIILESMVSYLVKGEKLELRGFGTFYIKQRGARVARNLKTNETLPLPPRKVIYFKSGKGLKVVNKPEGQTDAK